VIIVDHALAMVVVRERSALAIDKAQQPGGIGQSQSPETRSRRPAAFAVASVLARAMGGVAGRRSAGSGRPRTASLDGRSATLGQNREAPAPAAA